MQADCPDPPGASVYRVTDGFIFPGFIDAHNHVAYNVFQKWTPPKLYQNRGQWQRAKEYAAFKAPYNELKKTGVLRDGQVWRIKALLGGLTTVQGTAPHYTSFCTLIRNAENENQLGLPASQIRTFILDVSSYNGRPPNFAITTAFVIHLSEGIDERSRKKLTPSRPSTSRRHGRRPSTAWRSGTPSSQRWRKCARS